MVPALDPMGGSTSFAARRPNASNLPSFELPPPPLASLQQPKYPGLSSLSSNNSAPTASTLTSVGNLLTPPSNSSADGLSPVSGVSGSTQGAFTPSSSGMWPPPSNGSTPYTFQSGQPPQSFGQGRGLFSPSLNSIVRGGNSSTTSESLPPPPFELPQYSASTLPMSAPSLPAIPSHQTQNMVGSSMVGSQTPVSTSVTHPSPVSLHADSFARQPPTPTYYNGSQPPSANPQQGSFSYPTGPSPVQQSPVGSAGQLKMSPMNGHGPIPPLHQSHPHQYYRTPSYSMPGPVLSNVNNPGGQLQMIGGGVPHGMIPAFNSGHAAQIHMYGQHAQHQASPQNDRPFRCDQCPQSFNRNHDLKRHKRIHLAVKPFPCGHCDKSFSRKDALKRHVLVKGCGKANASAEVKEVDGSTSPESKSEDMHNSPVVTATA